MTPAKRRPATPAGQGPTRTAPDVPIVATPSAVAPTETKDGAQLLGPEGEPIDQDAPRRDSSRDSAPPMDAGEVAAEDRATTQSSRRPGGLY
ncbi:MAG TPA: hypothetical protein VNT52_05645, partial [Acidimicrobiales bacterium]|nr:hypothetical protein [Acidimicrobiales bacterium]